MLITATVFVSTFFLKVYNSLAATFKEISGLGTSGDNAGYTANLQNISGEGLIIQIINLVLTFVGVAFLILMIYGGISWMTAAGNDTKVDKAKKILIAGVIGIIVVFSAYVISQFVVGFFSQQTLN
ncbi:MAG: hypothetical protein PF488_00715 [Patescibacteria group bacterium]|nr:hypothetical protein [Patescibacteria group bacterium]